MDTQDRPAHASLASPALGLGVAGLVIGLAVLLWVGATYGGVRASVWLTPRPAPAGLPRLTALPAQPPIPLEVATRGRDVFVRACTICHGPTGTGVQGLGKNLVRSEFVADRTDEELVAFVNIGRPADHPLNTTRVAMPPKGGMDSLAQDDIVSVVAYLRGLQDPRRMPDLPAWTPAPVVVSQQDKADALAAAGGDAELAEYIASGAKLFSSTCIACHGPAGVGIKGNGKALVSNEFIKSLDDDRLLAFIKAGRDPGDPKNTTGIAMPPKGGNPAFSDDDLLDIIAYLRTLQGTSTGANQK